MPRISDPTLVRVILFAQFLWPLCSASVQSSTDNLYQLLASVRRQQLWTRPEWMVLLHYAPSLSGSGSTSFIDDPAFFLNAQGKYSPQAELESTLKQLFGEIQKPLDSPNNAVACRFPARLAWLRKTLKIDRHALPEMHCPKLSNWLDHLQADQLSLIFPVSVLNSPASMFGHTFLRFDRKTRKQPDLFAWTINYAARTESERGIGFALKGLFGGYRGKFSIARYYERVKEYSDIESRDIWEYQLAFSPEEIHRLQLHLWELMPTYFDYYFVDENCAYQLLTLFDAARPSLQLSRQFYWDAMPAETVRAITGKPGLLKKIKYRPSNRQVILARGSALSRTHQNLARSIGLGEITPGDARLKRLEIHQQALVLELAYDYAAYLDALSQKKRFSVPFTSPQQRPEDRKALLHQLLTERSQLPVASQHPVIATPRFRPDQGHSGHRAALRYGYEHPRHFLQMDFRWAYHDLYDPSSGFIGGAQLEFIKPALRYYPQQQQISLESIGLVNIISAPLWEPMIRPFSWELSAAIRRYRFAASKRPLTGDFSAGMGVSYPVTAQSRLSLFANTAVTIGEDFDQYIALAGGGRAELIGHLNDVWQIGLSARVMRYFQGITGTSYKYASKQRLSLGKNQAVLLELSRSKEFGPAFFAAHLSWQVYF